MKKDKIINCKVTEEAKEAFETACLDNCTTPSHELRLFIHKYIKMNRGEKALLPNHNNKV